MTKRNPDDPLLSRAQIHVLGVLRRGGSLELKPTHAGYKGDFVLWRKGKLVDVGEPVVFKTVHRLLREGKAIVVASKGEARWKTARRGRPKWRSNSRSRRS
jgi:hypothetical protein